MVENIREGRHPGIALRETDDLTRLVGSFRYRAGRLARKAWVYFGIPVRGASLDLARRLFRGTWVETCWKRRRGRI
jgi:hypothetical protein